MEQPAKTPLEKWLNLPKDLVPGHVGLWLDRCLVEETIPKEKEAHPGRDFLVRVAIDALRMSKDSGEDAPAIREYRSIFARWEQRMQQSVPGMVRRVYRLRALSRIVLHPATNETVTEGGVLLHHTYGVPYIPGSALKGAARAWAMGRGLEDPPPGILPNQRIEEMTWMDHLFGLERDSDKEWLQARKDAGESDDRPDTAGMFDFMDALLVPEMPPKAKKTFSPLALDIVNPHFVEYYTKNTGDKVHPPRETSDPVPSHFLTISPGTTFLLVVETRDATGTVFARWLDWMLMELLNPALRELGIGAKTSSGYGRLEILGLARKAAAGEEPGPSMGIGWVTYTRGESKLRAFFRDENAYAELRGAAAAEMVGGLSEATRGRLAKGKEVRLRVYWEPVGNARRIVRIAEG